LNEHRITTGSNGEKRRMNQKNKTLWVGVVGGKKNKATGTT